jgi:hypothetical protein
MATLRFVLSIILSIGLTGVLQRWDRRRLSPVQQERAWNAASWGAALYAFGPLSMVGWACVTRIAAAHWWPRRRLARVGAGVMVVAAGLACALAIALVVSLADDLVGRLAGHVGSHSEGPPTPPGLDGQPSEIPKTRPSRSADPSRSGGKTPRP